ncbi:hypothetical protein [Parazoarcus communis]|uniref:Uncharacterized protein n=1 Tax=Parazoarcus communis SWub3 = DSM 12120 TaxID=1121029 RepID=A0A323URJ5_9RHOO|nr:hypothetical protein [Parazoarcus communis]NMG71847.1 hypothetical protein [Parazoarcus communis SWub3 = DSM 12120]PZA14957.1 hypothetical protein DNK49_19125 [Azoarcus communis] [Parazoarcus communis SWub3 = DSM 12120]
MVNDLPSLGPFAGMNNRLPDHRLRIADGGDYLRNAINVDITDAGTIQRRKGSTLTQAGSACHSLWADGPAAYYADGDTLYKWPRTAVRSGLLPGARCSFAKAPDGWVYWSNGVVLERTKGASSEPAGIAVPNPAPSVTATVGGALPAGYYQVAITAVMDGRESGATWPAQVAVPQGGVVQVTGMPAGLKNIYMSSLNGDVLFHVVTTTFTSYAFPVMPSLGAQLQTLGLSPMPAGHIVRWDKGRLVVAQANVAYISEPYAPGWFSPGRGYLPFPGRITMYRPVDGGRYIATHDKTWWLPSGDVEAGQLVEVLPYGVVEGTDATVENSTDVLWFSTRGMVRASAGGEVRNIQESNVAVGGAQRGAMLWREQDGMRQAVAALLGVSDTLAPARTYIAADAAREGEML